MTRYLQRRARGMAALGAAFASLAQAQPPAATPAPQDVAVAPPFGTADTVDQTELAQIAGRADVGQYIQAENNSTVSRNTVSGNSVTGTIAFDAQAFQNMNGLSVLSANTGNNVAINSSLNVNVALHP